MLEECLDFKGAIAFLRLFGAKNPRARSLDDADTECVGLPVPPCSSDRCFSACCLSRASLLFSRCSPTSSRSGSVHETSNIFAWIKDHCC